MKFIVLLVCATWCSAIALAEESLTMRLENHKQQYQQASDTANQARSTLDTSQIELRSAQSRLQTLKKERDTERAKLDELRNTEAKMDVDLTDQINHQSEIASGVGKKYQSQLGQIKALEEKIQEKKTQYAVAVEQQKSLKSSINGIHEQMASAALQQRLQGINQPRSISVETRETCGADNITQRACRDQAKAKAERQAAEKGSVVMVESVTEIKNFNMTKDEIKSRLKVRLSNIQVTRDDINLTADKSGWVVDYAITATVTPVVTDEMRNEMKAQIMAEISGSWNPDTSTPPFHTEVSETEKDELPGAPIVVEAPTPHYAPTSKPAPVSTYSAPKPPSPSPSKSKSNKNFGAW